MHEKKTSRRGGWGKQRICGALKNMDWHRSELTRVKDLLEFRDKPPHDDILIRAFGVRRQIE